jgi:hypothetical protein
MGFTHYWRTEKQVTKQQFEKLTAATTKVLEAVQRDVPLAFECDEQDKDPEVSADLIRFNGCGEDGHETFYIEREATGFNFCKTARKPYDIAVVAVLCLFEHYTKGNSGVSSDGDADDWAAGLKLAQSVEPKCKMPSALEGARKAV